jgi:hypothetical protein
MINEFCLQNMFISHVLNIENGFPTLLITGPRKKKSFFDNDDIIFWTIGAMTFNCWYLQRKLNKKC